MNDVRVADTAAVGMAGDVDDMIFRDEPVAVSDR